MSHSLASLSNEAVLTLNRTEMAVLRHIAGVGTTDRLTVKRTNIAKAVYTKYLASLPDDAAGPFMDEFLQFPPVSSFISHSDPSKGQASDFEAVLRGVQAFEEELCSRQAYDHDTGQFSRPPLLLRSQAARSNLAVDVTLASFGPIGAKSVIKPLDLVLSPYGQQSNRPEHLKAYFDPAVKASLTSLLESAGVDPSTTTVEEMDELDFRFYCHLYVERKGSSLAYSWQDCVGASI